MIKLVLKFMLLEHLFNLNTRLSIKLIYVCLFIWFYLTFYVAKSGDQNDLPESVPWKVIRKNSWLKGCNACCCIRLLDIMHKTRFHFLPLSSYKVLFWWWTLKWLTSLNLQQKAFWSKFMLDWTWIVCNS
jgi:hypothetical protein